MDSQNYNSTGNAAQSQDHGGSHNSADNKNLMAILAYIGPLVIVSYLSAKDDSFVKYHIKQGLVLFGLEIAVPLLMSIVSWQFYMLWNIWNLATIVLSVLGIINVTHGREKELPLIGSFAKMIKI